MKKMICLALAAIFSMSILVSCGKEESVSSTTVDTPVVESQTVSDPLPQKEPVISAETDEATTAASAPTEQPVTTTVTTTVKEQKNEKTAILYCVYGSRIDMTEIEWEGDFLDSKFLISELSKYTGINMNCANAFSGKGGISVDFDNSSPLFGGELYITDSPKYRMDNYDSAVWFILDSIYETLKNNNGGNVDIYFSKMGENIVLKTSPEVTIEMTKPYRGSSAYIG